MYYWGLALGRVDASGSSCAMRVAALAMLVARGGRRVTLSGKPLPATYLRSGDDTASRRCANSAKNTRAHICGL